MSNDTLRDLSDRLATLEAVVAAIATKVGIPVLPQAAASAATPVVASGEGARSDVGGQEPSHSQGTKNVSDGNQDEYLWQANPPRFVKRSVLQSGAAAAPGAGVLVNSTGRLRADLGGLASRDFESRSLVGGWLGIVGVLCFILAAGFFIKLAVDSGWLTPERQLVGAAVFGLMLIGGSYGLKLLDRGHSALLAGCGVVVLFMSAYAGHLHYSFYGAEQAALFIAGIAVLSVALARSFQSEALVGCALLGSYSVPLLIGHYRADYGHTAQYFLLWDLLFCGLAVVVRQRRIISVAGHLSIILYALLFPGVTQTASHDLLRFTAAFQAIQFLIFVAGIVWFSIRHKRSLTELEAWYLFPVLVIFYGVEYWLIDSLYPSSAPYIALAFAALLYGLTQGVRVCLGNDSHPAMPVVAAAIALISVHAIYFELSNDSLRPWLGMVVFVSLPVLARILPPTSHGLAYLFVGVPLALEFLRPFSNFDRAEYWTRDCVISGIYFSVLFFGVYLRDRLGKKGKDSLGELSALVLGAAAAQGLLACNYLSHLLVPKEIASYLTSALWGLIALFALLFARASSDRLLSSFALAIFGLVSAKVLLFDVSAQHALARIVSLLTVGAALYVGGLIHRRIN